MQMIDVEFPPELPVGCVVRDRDGIVWERKDAHYFEDPMRSWVAVCSCLFGGPEIERVNWGSLLSRSPLVVLWDSRLANGGVSSDENGETQL